MNQFQRICFDIKNVKIQGAESVAKAGIKAFLLKPEKSSAKKLISLRSTEPMLANCLNILLQQSPRNVTEKAKELLKYIDESHKKIAEYGASIISDQSKILVHCHSSTVISILKEAKKQNKKFEIYNAETQPLFQGRKTAKELAKAGIFVIHLSDLAAKYAIQSSNLFLFGVDAFTNAGVYNKVGTSIYSALARDYKTKVYPCGTLLKYAPYTDLEFRNPSELWNEKSEKIITINPAFDLTERAYISKVICEEGIVSYRKLIKKSINLLKKLS